LEVKEYIKIYDNCIDFKTLSNFLRYINTLDFEKATIGSQNKINFEIRKTFNYTLSNLSNIFSDVHWHNYLVFVFNNAYKDYCGRFKYAAFKNLEPINILKYEEGGFYRDHVDHFTEIPRTLSAIFFLNNDYQGGNLCFNIGGEELIIETIPNRMIVWPSNFLFPHQVKPVTKGVRYSVVSWAL